MAHAQKPDFVSLRNGRVHLNRWRCQFSRLLAAEVCASAWVMLDRQRSEVGWEYWLHTPFASFPFTSPTVRHRVPPGSERALPCQHWILLTSQTAANNETYKHSKTSIRYLQATIDKKNPTTVHIKEGWEKSKLLDRTLYYICLFPRFGPERQSSEQ